MAHFRKNIRLKDYDYNSPGYYFITLVTFNRQDLFQLKEGYWEDPRDLVFEELNRLTREYPETSLVDFVVMPDHIHFILSIDKPMEEGGLGQLMRLFKGRTHRAYGKGVHEGKYPAYQKKLWQKGYYEHVIRSDEALMEIRRYMEENPMKEALLREWLEKARERKE